MPSASASPINKLAGASSVGPLASIAPVAIVRSARTHPRAPPSCPSRSPSRAAIMSLLHTLARGHHVPPAPPKGAGAAPKAADARRLRSPEGANGRSPLELQCDGLALRSIPQQLLGRVVEAVASHTARGDGGTRGTCSGHKAAHTTQSHPTWDVCASHKAQGGDCCSHGQVRVCQQKASSQSSPKKASSGSTRQSARASGSRKAEHECQRLLTIMKAVISGGDAHSSVARVPFCLSASASAFTPERSLTKSPSSLK